jgi:hypothetical protein
MMFTVLLLLRRERHLIRQMERTSQLVLRKWAAIIIDTSAVPEDSNKLFFATPSAEEEERLRTVWSLSESNPTGVWQDLRTSDKPRDAYITFASSACLSTDEFIPDECVNMFLSILRDRVQVATSPGLANSFFCVKAAESTTNKELLCRKLMKYLGNSNSTKVALSNVTSLLIPMNLPEYHWGVMEVSSGWMTLFDGSKLHDVSEKWKTCIDSIDSFLSMTPLPSIACWDRKATQLTPDSLFQLLYDASLPSNWPAVHDERVDELRAEVVEQLTDKVRKNMTFRTILSMEFILDGNLQNAAQPEAGDVINADDPAENARFYLIAMAKPFVWGGYPELEVLSTLLGCPILVYDHPVAGQFKISCHFNHTKNARPMFLLRSNVHRPKATHFQLMIPVVPFADLFNSAGYGPMLRAALAFVVVHPARITVSDGSGHSANFYVFGSQGDGNCLFRAAVLYKIVSAPENQEGSSLWRRKLPQIEESIVETAEKVQAQWRLTTSLRNCAWSGKSVFDDSTVMGILKMWRALFLHIPSVDDEKAVHFDAGHGLGVVQAAIAVGSKRTAIGVEFDPELHCIAKQCHLRMRAQADEKDPHLADTERGKLAFRCLDFANASLKFDGVHVVHSYESMAGRSENVNTEHMQYIERLLATSTVNIITTTKVQSKLLAMYRSLSTIIDEQLTHSWVVASFDGPRRRGNDPGNYVFMRWTGILNGIDFEKCTLDCNASQGPIGELVGAARQISQGILWSITSGTVDKRELSHKVAGVTHEGEELCMILGLFEFQCHLTGLKLVTGCAVTTRQADQRGWLIGFATSRLSSFSADTPAFLVLQNDAVPRPQYLIIPQVDLISADATTESNMHRNDEFKAAKDYFLNLAQTDVTYTERRVSKRIAKSSKKDEEVIMMEQGAKSARLGSDERPKSDSVSGSDSAAQELEHEKKTKSPQEKEHEKIKQQLNALKTKNDENKAKIKTLQQGNRRRAHAARSYSRRTEDTATDDHEPESEPPPKKPKGGGSGKPKVHPEKPEVVEPKIGGGFETEESAEAKRRAAELQQLLRKIDSAEAKQEHDRGLDAKLKNMQDAIVAELKATANVEKIRLKQKDNEEKDCRVSNHFDMLHNDFVALKNDLLAKEKATEVQKLQQTNLELVNILKKRDTEADDRSLQH